MDGWVKVGYACTIGSRPFTVDMPRTRAMTHRNTDIVAALHGRRGTAGQCFCRFTGPLCLPDTEHTIPTLVRILEPKPCPNPTG